MTKNILIIVSLLIIVLVAGWFYKQSREVDDGLLASERALNMQIAEISMEGTVLKVESDSLLVSTMKIERTEKGNELVELQRTVWFEDTVQIMGDRQTSEVSGSDVLVNLKAGDKVVFYGSGATNTLTGEEFTASRIDILD